MYLAICAVMLVVNVYLLVKLRNDDAFLRTYVATSPKAFLWRKAFGEERAAAMIRNFFVPLGAVLWVFLLFVFGFGMIVEMAIASKAGTP